MLAYRYGKFAYRTACLTVPTPEEVDVRLIGGIVPVRLPDAEQAHSCQPEGRCWISRVARPAEWLPVAAGAVT